MQFEKTDKRRQRKRRLIATITMVAVLAVLFGSYEYWMREQGNFRTVTAGEAYRSAQLDRDELAGYTTKYGIRSVINLRGKSQTASWYRDEIDFCAGHGIDHYDLQLSAGTQPSPEQMDSLVTIFRTAPRPVLIHCMAGADRSGLAAAIWKMEIDGVTPPEAERQLSIQYGHLPFGSTQAMNRAFAAFVQSQAELVR